MRLADEHEKWAWELATTTNEKLRDPKLALTHARKAVKSRGGAKRRITLCLALYRNDLCAQVVAESEFLSRGWSSILRPLYDSAYYILAMAHWKLGNRDDACAWYDRAAKQGDYRLTRNADVQRFREEAAEVLGIEDGGKVQPAGAKPFGGIDSEVVAAWKKAYARFGYIWKVNGMGSPSFARFWSTAWLRVRQRCRARSGCAPSPNVPFGLSIMQAGLNDAGLKKFTGFKQLHHLRLQFNSVTYEGLKELVALDQLRQLELRDVIKNTDADLKPLAGLKHLETLRLYGSRVTDAHLQGCPN